MADSLTLLRPFDAHVHLREGAMLRAVAPFTAEAFERAVVMPNLKQPVATSALAKEYRDEILSVLPEGSPFEPLMTLYLTETTDPADCVQGFKAKIVCAAKLYPANATTNSAKGVIDIAHLTPVLSRMEILGMPLLIHGEVTDPFVDIFDREAVFIERVLIPLRRDFPALKIVLEHVTTEEGVAYVQQEGTGGLLAATITAHHLHINRNALFNGGLRPHNYCLPVAKREKHRLALIKAATSGQKMFFLGTDSAPHPDQAKESACGCAGIFTAANALALYAQAFDDAGRLENLEDFASKNGPAFYGLAPSSAKIVMKRGIGEAIKPILTEEGQKITSFAPPSRVSWGVARV